MPKYQVTVYPLFCCQTTVTAKDFEQATRKAEKEILDVMLGKGKWRLSITVNNLEIVFAYDLGEMAYVQKIDKDGKLIEAQDVVLEEIPLED